jgi:hypothetical protein
MASRCKGRECRFGHLRQFETQRVRNHEFLAVINAGYAIPGLLFARRPPFRPGSDVCRPVFRELMRLMRVCQVSF